MHLAEARATEQISFVGMGWTFGLAEEAALKLKESTQSWTESYYMTEYRHGPISIAAPGRTVWAFGPLVPGFAADLGPPACTLTAGDLDPLAELVRGAPAVPAARRRPRSGRRRSPQPDPISHP